MADARCALPGQWWLNDRRGARFMRSDTISVDLGAARAGPGATRVHVIGLNQTFAR